VTTKRVATKGCVVATPGTDTTGGTPGATGTWTPTAVVETAYTRLTAGQVAVIYKASCTFQYAGTLPNNPPVTTRHRSR
jgi:hypothetical protein